MGGLGPQSLEAGEVGEVTWWDWYEENFKGYIKSRKYAEKLMKWTRSDDPEGANRASHDLRCSATIAARTASTGDVIGGRCSTAKNRRLSLPSIGDDQA